MTSYAEIRTDIMYSIERLLQDILKRMENMRHTKDVAHPIHRSNASGLPQTAPASEPIAAPKNSIKFAEYNPNTDYSLEDH